nr:abnormal spindle-like microcephaly-associated protein homolog [Tanacetum cinerariifolium]
FTGEDWPDGSSKVFLGEKRDGTGHGGVELDREWRGPKRRKDELWIHKNELENKFSSTMYSRLKVSLGNICSLDDMKERMATYLGLTTCKVILDLMTHVTKNIDEGRLKVKAHCPIVTDVGMKENALKILMSYNPVWLRVGLYIVFGGESLLPKPNAYTSSDASFLKMVAPKLWWLGWSITSSHGNQLGGDEELAERRMVRRGPANMVARRVTEDLIVFSGETAPPRHMKFFLTQKLAEIRRCMNRMRKEADTLRDCIAQLTAVIAELQAMADQDEVHDSLLTTKDAKRSEQSKLVALNDVIVEALEENETQEVNVDILDGGNDDV